MSRPNGVTPLYEEVQRPRQWWILAILVGCFALFIWMFVNQLTEPQMENRPFALFISVFVFVVLGLIIVTFLSMSLRTQILPSGIMIRYQPIAKKFVTWEQIQSFQKVKYRPIKEYGGWGIRGLGGDMAYSISGSFGVKLFLKDGNKILIGSLNPDVLVHEIRSHGNDSIHERSADIE